MLLRTVEEELGKDNFAILAELEHMQPTAAANLPPPGGDMDLQTMQSMDWLFKKERIYLLAQFWQQVGGIYFFPAYDAFLQNKKIIGNFKKVLV